MGMTVVEKILARASGQSTVAPGDLLVTNVDTVVLIDPSFYPGVWREILKLDDPSKIVVGYDHRVPAPDRTVAAMHGIGREFVARFGIERFFDVGYDQGISHVIV